MISNSLLDKLIRLNKGIIVWIIIAFLFGIAMLYSAAGGSFSPWATRQMIYFLIFFHIMLLIAFTDINIWFKFSYPIYFFVLFLLLMVEIIGHTAMGATRWIRFFGISLQPSELMKIATVIGLARYFYTKDEKEIKSFKYIIPPTLMVLIPMALILYQPDLGTSIILLTLGAVIFFLIGVQWWKFAICGVLLLSAAPLAWKYVLKDYQKNRVMVFIDPESDPLGKGYNITQSKIAIGSGGFFGKGYLKGTQGQLAFLPEKQTDFIFTMLSEETGFIGAISVVIIFMVIISYTIFMAIDAKNSYCKSIIGGVSTIIFIQSFVNMGMVMGIFPVVGVPLPLFSYGGTMIATTLISIGFLLNADLYGKSEIKVG